MKFLGIVSLAFVLLTSTAAAGFCTEMEELHIYFNTEYFTWKEFASAGEVKEDGPLFGAGGALKLGFLERSLTLKSKLELFGGIINYDGFSQRIDTATNSVVTSPSQTDADYFGVKVEEDLGWHIPLGKASIEPLFGIGYRWWRRDIQAGVDAAGNAVSETVEYWHNLYTRFGLRGDYRLSPDLLIFAEGGAKYSFLNRNEAGNGVTVDPGEEWSAFAELGLKYGNFRPSFFYEGFRFARSPSVPIGGGFFVFQPKSESDIFGLSLGYAFR